MMSVKKLDEIYTMLSDLQDEIHQKEKEAEMLKDKLKAEMEKRGADQLEGTGWRATWRESESSRFDSAAFKAEHPKTFAKYLRNCTVKRFTVNAVKN